MPERCPPNQKRRALERLDLCDNNLPAVQGLTGIPSSTRHDWCKQRLPDNPDLSGQKKFPFPENIRKTERIPESLTPPPPTKTPLYRYCIYTLCQNTGVYGGFKGILEGKRASRSILDSAPAAS